MHEELGLKQAEEDHLLRTAAIVGTSAVFGSLVPLMPYFFLPTYQSLPVSLGFSALVLFLLGVYKAKVTIGNKFRSGWELTIIGILSALAGYGISLFVSGNYTILSG